MIQWRGLASLAGLGARKASDAQRLRRPAIRLANPVETSRSPGAEAVVSAAQPLKPLACWQLHCPCKWGLSNFLRQPQAQGRPRTSPRQQPCSCWCRPRPPWHTSKLAVLRSRVPPGGEQQRRRRARCLGRLDRRAVCEVLQRLSALLDVALLAARRDADCSRCVRR